MIRVNATLTKMDVKGILNNAGRKVQAGLEAAAEKLYFLSQDLVPRDTAALALSGGFWRIGSLFSTEMIVGYGLKGFSMTEYSSREGRMVHRVPYEYALPVHELPAGQGYGFSSRPGYLTDPCLTHTIEIGMAFVAAFRAG